MKLSILALAVVAGVSLSACASMSPLAVNTKASPEVQKVEADAKAAFDKALADRLAHCDIRGSLNVGIGGIAATGTGAATSLGLTCPAQPWDPVPVNQSPAPVAPAPAQ